MGVRDTRVEPSGFVAEPLVPPRKKWLGYFDPEILKAALVVIHFNALCSYPLMASAHEPFFGSVPLALQYQRNLTSL